MILALPPLYYSLIVFFPNLSITLLLTFVQTSQSEQSLEDFVPAAAFSLFKVSNFNDKAPA
jgi:hypothetical protein